MKKLLTIFCLTMQRYSLMLAPANLFSESAKIFSKHNQLSYLSFEDNAYKCWI